LAAESNTPSFEVDVSQEIARILPSNVQQQPGGLFVPTSLAGFEGDRGHLVMTRTGLDSKTSTKGSELVFTESGSLIDALRAKTRVIALGAILLHDLRNNVEFARLAIGTESEWVSENPGVDQSDGSQAFAADRVALRPSSLMSPSIAFSRQLLMQATPAVDKMVTGDVALGNALAIDKASLHGSGVASEPEGIYQASGVSSVAFGGAVTKAKVVEMEKAVGVLNADVGPMGYITTPEVRAAARMTQVFSGNGGPLWVGNNENGQMNDYHAVATNQISKTLGAGSEHGIVFGVWSELIIGEWGATQIVIDPFTSKKQGMIEVNSFALVGLALRHGESFAKGTGLTAT
jgi:HK97 family phage major capsid protein